MKSLLSNFSSIFSPAVPVPPKGAYVISHTFSGVVDCFDVEEIWARARFGRRDSERLKGLLEECMYKDREQKRWVHFHIVLELPANMVERDRRLSRGGNSNCKTLALRLTTALKTDFGKFLERDAVPCFVVEPALDLEDEQVRVRFGHGVYLPVTGEAAAWRVEASCDCLTPESREAASIAEKQYLVLLGGSESKASIACPDWPFAASIVLINTPDQENLAISAEPLNALSVHFNEKLKCHVIEGPGKMEVGETTARYYLRLTRLLPSRDVTVDRKKPLQVPPEVSVVIAPDVQVSGKGLERIEPWVLRDMSPMDLAGAELEPIEPARPDVAPMEVSAAEIPERATMLPGDDTAPAANAETWVYNRPPAQVPFMALAGLALQRPSQFLRYGIRALAFGLDHGGRIVLPESAASVVRINIDQNDVVEAVSRHGQRVLEVGEYLPLPNGDTIGLEALPDELAEHYLGWIRLSSAPKLVLAEGQEFLTGRDPQKTNTAALQVLSGKGFLSARQDPGADCMGISSEHCRFQLEASGGVLVKAQGQLPIAVLGADFRFVAQIGGGENIVLADGQCLVVGNYVWQFRASGS